MRRLGVALAALLLAAGCGRTTWESAARDAAEAARGGDAQARLEAGELALLVEAQPEAAKEHLLAALRAPKASGATRARAALALVHLGHLTGEAEVVLEALERGLPGAGPHEAEALAGSASMVWGADAETGPVPPRLHELLTQLADRPGAEWEPARAEARAQLLTAAELLGEPDRVAAARVRAGRAIYYRLSSPWPGEPVLDLRTELGPETRPLAERETVPAPYTSARTASLPSWHLAFSDGELHFFDLPREGAIGFAETWIDLPPGADRRVVVRLEANRSVRLYANAAPVLEHDRFGETGPWQRRVALKLPDGPTRLLVKLATEDGSGFARLHVSHLMGAAEVVVDSGPAAALGGAAEVIPAPPGFVEAFPRQVGTARPADFFRAIHVFEALVHRPVRDARAAGEVLAALSRALPEYPGLFEAQARLEAVDPHLPRQLAEGRMRQSLRKVMEWWPALPGVLRAMARLEARDERHDAALALYQQALELRPRDPRTLIELLDWQTERGWEADALETAGRLAELAPAAPRVLQEVFDAYDRFGHRDRAIEALAQLTELFPRAALSRAAHLAEASGQLAEAAALNLEQWKAHNERLALARRAVALLRAADDTKGAAKVVEMVLRRRPRDAWALGARVLLALQEGRHAEAGALIDAALEAHPDGTHLSSLGAWIAGRPEPLDAVEDGRALLDAWNAQGVAQGAGGEGRPDTSRHPVVTLLDRTAMQVRADGRVLSLTHVVRVVQSKGAADQLGELRPPQGARVLVVRTLKADGRVLWPDRVPGKPDLSFSDLQPGDAVEWAWVERGSVRPEEGGYLGGLAFASWDAPTVHKRIDVTVADGLTLVPRPRGQAPEPRVTMLPGGGRGYHWQLQHLPAVPREPNAAHARTFFPFIDLTVTRAGQGQDDAAAWLAIARWYAARLEQLARPGARVAQARAQIAENAQPGGLGAAWAAFDHVKQKMAISESYNSFESTAEAALALGKGNRTVVLLALARALDVPAKVWLCAPETDGATGDEARPLPNANRFWYPLVGFDLGDETMWVDPSRPYYPFGVLAAPLRGAACMDPAAWPRGAQALFVRLPEEGGREVRPPGWDFDIALKVDADGTARGTLTGQGFGHAANGLRHVYLNADEARQQLLWQQWAASVLPGARVEAVEVEDERNPDAPMRWTLQLEIPGYLRKDGAGLATSQLVATLLGNQLGAAPALEELIALPGRQTPLRLEPHEERLKLTIEGPAGLKAASPLEALKLETPLLALNQTAEAQAARLVLERSVTVRPGRVDPADYVAFRAQAVRAVGAMSRGLTLTP